MNALRAGRLAVSVAAGCAIALLAILALSKSRPRPSAARVEQGGHQPAGAAAEAAADPKAGAKLAPSGARDLLGRLRAALERKDTAEADRLRAALLELGAAAIDDVVTELVQGAAHAGSEYWLSLIGLLRPGVSIEHIPRIRDELLKCASATDAVRGGYRSTLASVLGSMLSLLAAKGHAAEASVALRDILSAATQADVKTSIVASLAAFPPGSPELRSLIAEILATTTDRDVRAQVLQVMTSLNDPALTPEIVTRAEEGLRGARAGKTEGPPDAYIDALTAALGFRDAARLVLEWTMDSQDGSLPAQVAEAIAERLRADPSNAAALLDLVPGARSPMQMACLLATLNGSSVDDPRLLAYARASALQDQPPPLVYAEAIRVLQRRADETTFLAAVPRGAVSTDAAVRASALTALAAYPFDHPNATGVTEYAQRLVREGPPQSAVQLVEVMGLTMSRPGREPLYLEFLKSQAASAPNAAVREAAANAVSAYERSRDMADK